MTWNQRSSGLARNPPFVVEVSVDRKLDDFMPLFTGYAMDRIVNLAGRSQARGMFQRLMEEDGAAFTALVQDLADGVQFCVDSEQLDYNQVEQAIRNITPIVVDAYLALAVQNYPNEFSPYLDQQQVNDIPAYIQPLEDLKYNARLFYGSQNGGGWRNDSGGGRRGWQPGNNNGNRASARRSFGGRSSQWDEPDERPQDGYRQANDGWPGTGAGRVNRRGNQQSAGNTIWDTSPVSNRGGGGGSNSDDTNVRQRRHFDEPTPRGRVNPRHAVQQTNPKQEVVDGQTFVPARTDKDYPKVVDLNRLFDWVLMEDGTQMRPAHLSNWTVTFNPQVPATPWYDPDTHMLFHYKNPNGTVEECLLKREEGMKYLDHELNPHLRQIARGSAEADTKVAPAWRLIEQLRPQPSAPLATAGAIGEDGDGITVSRLTTPKEYLTSTSLFDAFKRICLRLKMDDPNVLKSAFEVYVDRAVLTSIANPDFEHLENLARAESFTALFDLLMEKTPDAELADAVDKRIAEAISLALQQNMGLRGWKITSFREDISDLLAALNEDYGEAVVATLQAYAIEIISRDLVFFDKEELKQVRSLVGLTEDQTALIWRERCSITRIPLTAEELRVPNVDGTLVAESAAPELYQTLNSIFERTQDLPHSFNSRYLVTTNGVVYEIVRGYFNDQSILLYKADFNLQ